MSLIVDTAANVTLNGRLEALRSAAGGDLTVGRYLTPTTQGQKLFKLPEAQEFARTKTPVFLVFEIWGGANNFEHNDITAESGVAHANFVKRYAPTIGCPPGTIIWFAVDNDAQAGPIRQRIFPYFQAIKQTMGGAYRIGIYGAGAACEACLDAGYADAAWLSNATGWAGYQRFLASKRWVLLQQRERMIAGVSVDPNIANGDFGAFIPRLGHVEVVKPNPVPVPVPEKPVDSEPHTGAGPDDPVAAPVPGGFFSRIRNWLSTSAAGGGLFGGLAFLSDWQIAALVIGAIVLLVWAAFGVMLWLYGKDGVKKILRGEAP